MTEALILLAAALVFVVIEMTLAWFVARQLRNNGIVDIVWSTGFAPLALLYFFVDPVEGREFEMLPRWIAITTMVVIWSLRLGTHLFVRVRAHHPREDVRYAKLRDEWGAATDRKMFGFFQLQGALQVLLSLPVMLVNLDKDRFVSGWGLGFTGVLGVALWVCGLLGESLADRQLARFRADPTNKGKVCQTGLWNYSRHPNYFFEWLVWVGYAVFALGSPWGWLGFIAPALMLHFLLNVTGIPMTEELSLKSKGDAYREYQRTTSAFVPWFKKPDNITLPDEGRLTAMRQKEDALLRDTAARWSEWQSMHFLLRQNLLERATGVVTAERLVQWAGEAVASGLNSPNLCILAGLSGPDELRDAEEHYRKALAELRIQPFTRELLLLLRASELAQSIRDGSLEVKRGVPMLECILRDLNYINCLKPWLYLAESMYPDGYNPMSDQQLEEAAEKEATAFLNRLVCSQ